MSQLLVHRENHVAILTLNRPDRRNALTAEMLRDLNGELQRLANDMTMRVVILQGTQPDFSSGFDLREAQDLPTSLMHGTQLVDCQLNLAQLGQVTIALVDGFCLAGGGALAAACDFCFCTEAAQFGYPVHKVGVVPTPGIPFLRRQLLQRDLADLVFSGELKSAQWAEDRRLVTQKLPTWEAVQERSAKLITSILADSPEAVRTTKRFTHHTLRRSLVDELHQAKQAFLAMRNHPESQEGINAFTEKRKPSWS